MAMQTTTSSGLTGQYQKYFNEQLLPHAKQALVLDQFGMKVPFPKNRGATQIRFTRPDVADATQVQSATEGVPITTFRNTTLTFIDATLNQYIEGYKVSDVLSWTNLFDTLKIGVMQLGEDAALHADTQIRNVVIPGITSAGNKRYAQGISSWANLAAATVSQGCLTITDVLDAMTRLDITRAPKLDGEYVGALPPQTLRDVMNDAKFVLAGQYGTSKGLFKGEAGSWYGIKMIRTTNPWVENGANAGTEQTYDNTGTAANSIYANLFVGHGAYGIPVVSGQSPFNPKVLICDKPDKSDPGNQFITAVWKSFWTVAVLNNQWAVVTRSKSVYV